MAKDAAVVWHDGGIAGILEPRACGAGYVNIAVLSFRKPPPLTSIDFRVMIAANQPYVWVPWRAITGMSLPRNLPQTIQNSVNPLDRKIWKPTQHVHVQVTVKNPTCTCTCTCWYRFVFFFDSGQGVGWVKRGILEEPGIRISKSHPHHHHHHHHH